MSKEDEIRCIGLDLHNPIQEAEEIGRRFDAARQSPPGEGKILNAQAKEFLKGYEDNLYNPFAKVVEAEMDAQKAHIDEMIDRATLDADDWAELANKAWARERRWKWAFWILTAGYLLGFIQHIIFEH